MALSTTITKKSVVQTQDGLYSVTLNLQYKDGVTVLLDRDFTENYWKGGTFNFVNFKARMKDTIQQYKDEQALFNGTVLATVVTNLNNQVGV